MRKKETIQIIITAVLIIILLFLVFGKKKKKSVKKSVSLKHLSPAELVLINEKENAGLYFRLEQEAKDIDLIRDPFSKMAIRARQGVSLIGIAWDPSNPMAIVDGEVVTIGDQINGKTVVDIKEDHVVINDGKKDIVITNER